MRCYKPHLMISNVLHRTCHSRLPENRMYAESIASTKENQHAHKQAALHVRDAAEMFGNSSASGGAETRQRSSAQTVRRPVSRFAPAIQWQAARRVGHDNFPPARRTHASEDSRAKGQGCIQPFTTPPSGTKCIRKISGENVLGPNARSLVLGGSSSWSGVVPSSAAMFNVGPSIRSYR